MVKKKSHKAVTVKSMLIDQTSGDINILNIYDNLSEILLIL